MRLYPEEVVRRIFDNGYHDVRSRSSEICIFVASGLSQLCWVRLLRVFAGDNKNPTLGHARVGRQSRTAQRHQVQKYGDKLLTFDL